MMRIKRSDLEAAGAAGIIAEGQAAQLWAYLESRENEVPAFRAAHILYYLGGLVAIGALTLFVTLAWDSWAGWPMFILALGFGVLGIALTEHFTGRHYTIPASVMVTFAVATVPLAVYSFQHLLGFWPGASHAADFHYYVDWRWIFMELATLAAAAIALWHYRLPFTVLLVAATLWYLSMDLVPLIMGPRVFNENYYIEYDYLHKLISLWMGVGVILLAFWIDIRSGRKRDYAFWLYLAGVAAFWGGLTLMNSHSEFSKGMYCLINLVMLAVGAVLMRRVFAIFGGIGIAVYLGHLASLFKDSLLFPVALAFIGILIIFAGILWQRHERRLHDTLTRFLPRPIQNLIAQIHA